MSDGLEAILSHEPLALSFHFSLQCCGELLNFTETRAILVIAWRRANRSPKDGIVFETHDGIPENVPDPVARAVPMTPDTLGGNYVLLDIGDGAYAFYAHLQPGSLKVKKSDQVYRGQVLALVGNTGNSTEPHLHFHVGDRNSPFDSEGIPYTFESFDLYHGERLPKLPNRDSPTCPWCQMDISRGPHAVGAERPGGSDAAGTYLLRGECGVFAGWALDRDGE